MSLNHRSRFLLVTLAASCVLVAAPTLAEAQRRRPVRRPSVHSVVVIRGYSYPRYRFYDPWFQWGPYGHPYPPYGYRYGMRDDLTSSLRLQVTPRDAQVFVDGYLAGVVDDFDGLLQRLRVEPGGHQITIYQEGYRTVREDIYLGPGAERRIRIDMERLRSGEQSELPPPAPTEVETREEAPMPGERGQRIQIEERVPARERTARFGTLSIRVQPSDAEIFIDGERWAAPADGDRVSIRLPEGRHRLEVRKNGFSVYAEDVLIRRESTLTLNVGLTEAPAAR